MNAIETHGLTKAYKDFTLGPLDLTLPSGCIMGLVGENGAGKSTTIKLLLNMLRKDGGTAALLGRDSLSDPRQLREEVGVVLDDVSFPGSLNAREIGKIMAGTFRRWDGDAYAGYLKKLSLPEDKKLKDFSRGMRMKLGIAAALSHNARLLLLDEATSGLDPVVRDEILDVFLDFARSEDHSILISSHIVSDLEKLCDYIAFLHKGKLLLCEEKDVLRERYAIVRCSREVLETLPETSVIGRKLTPYGAEAIVERSAVPQGVETGPVDIEQLFIFMVKEAQPV